MAVKRLLTIPHHFQTANFAGIACHCGSFTQDHNLLFNVSWYRKWHMGHFPIFTPLCLELIWEPSLFRVPHARVESSVWTLPSQLPVHALPSMMLQGCREHTRSYLAVWGNILSISCQNHFPMLSTKTTSLEFPRRQDTRLTSMRHSYQQDSGFPLEKLLLCGFVFPGPGRSRASYNNCHDTKLP